MLLWIKHVVVVCWPFLVDRNYVHYFLNRGRFWDIFWKDYWRRYYFSFWIFSCLFKFFQLAFIMFNMFICSISHFCKFNINFIKQSLLNWILISCQKVVVDSDIWEKLRRLSTLDISGWSELDASYFLCELIC